MSKQPLPSKNRSPRYDAAFKRRAAEQVFIHDQPVAAVARQFHCSPQSVANWVKQYQTVLHPNRSQQSKPSLSHSAKSSSRPSVDVEKCANKILHRENEVIDFHLRIIRTSVQAIEVFDHPLVHCDGLPTFGEAGERVLDACVPAKASCKKILKRRHASYSAVTTHSANIFSHCRKFPEKLQEIFRKNSQYLLTSSQYYEQL